VPFYNEGASLGEVLERLVRLKQVLPLEIVAVDDGSTDGSGEIAQKFPFVKCIIHPKNLGKGRAIISGLAQSTGKVVMIQDADCEYAPEEIPALVSPIMKGEADVVFGSRFMGKNWRDMSSSHAFGNRILSLVTSILYGVRVSDVMTGHKSFSRRAIESIELTEDGFEIEVEMTGKLLAKGWKLKEVPIDFVRRQNGVSKIGYKDGLTSLVRLFLLRLRV
jgi:glycosyltransferase involved in cell wall biosynthesis